MYSVGLIVDSTSVSKQVYDIVLLSKKSDIFKINCLIIQEVKPPSIFQRVIGVSVGYNIRKLFFKLLCKFESFFVRRFEKYNNFFDAYSLDDFDLKKIFIKPKTSKSRINYFYEKKDIHNIKTLNLDLLIRAGSGILRGDILNVCKNGIISFHHGDNDIYRGGPPGFWEVFNRENRTGFVIQKLNEELDGGEILFKGFIQTEFIYTLNIAKLYEKANPFFIKCIDDLLTKSSVLKDFKKIPCFNQLYKTPSVSIQAIYFLRTIITLIFKFLKHTLNYRIRWGIAYQFVDDWRNVALRKSIRVSNPPNRFFADPFIWYQNGVHYCFVEDYDYKKNRACISVLRISQSGYSFLGVAIEEPFHLSYPFVFNDGDNLYMCPETAGVKEVRLYKCVKFPLSWELHEVLMKNVSAADSNIFKWDDKWWLMTNLCSSGLDDHNSELHLFSTSDLHSFSWKPHSTNPVIFDTLLARNGGFIEENNNLFRVYQRQGFSMYGEAFGVSQITSLSQEDYSEENVFEVEAKFFDGLKGTHTYSFKKGLMVLDFSKTENCSK